MGRRCEGAHRPMYVGWIARLEEVAAVIMRGTAEAAAAVLARARNGSSRTSKRKGALRLVGGRSRESSRRVEAVVARRRWSIDDGRWATPTPIRRDVWGCELAGLASWTRYRIWARAGLWDNCIQRLEPFNVSLAQGLGAGRRLGVALGRNTKSVWGRLWCCCCCCWGDLRDPPDPACELRAKNCGTSHSER